MALSFQRVSFRYPYKHISLIVGGLSSPSLNFGSSTSAYYDFILVVLFINYYFIDVVQLFFYYYYKRTDDWSTNKVKKMELIKRNVTIARHLNFNCFFEHGRVVSLGRKYTERNLTFVGKTFALFLLLPLLFFSGFFWGVVGFDKKVVPYRAVSFSFKA